MEVGGLEGGALVTVGSRRGTGELDPRVDTLGTEKVGVVTINDGVVPEIVMYTRTCTLYMDPSLY